VQIRPEEDSGCVKAIVGTTKLFVLLLEFHQTLAFDGGGFEAPTTIGLGQPETLPQAHAEAKALHSGSANRRSE